MSIKFKPKIKKPAATKSPVQTSAVNYDYLPKIERPKFIDTLKFPDDITELEAANVSEMLGKYTKLQAYVSQDAARISVRILKLEAHKAKRVNEIFRDNPSINSQERWRRDAVIEEDTQIEEINRQLMLCKAQQTWANTYVGNFEKFIMALSRELTRKMGERPNNFSFKGQ